MPVSRSLGPLGEAARRGRAAGSCLVWGRQPSRPWEKALPFLRLRAGPARVIQRFRRRCASTTLVDRVPAPLLSHLAATDLSSVVSEEDLWSLRPPRLQAVSEDPRLQVQVVRPKEASSGPEEEAEEPPETVPGPRTRLFGVALVDSVFQVSVLPGNVGYLRSTALLMPPLLEVLGPYILRQVWEPLQDTEHPAHGLRRNSRGPSPPRCPCCCPTSRAPTPAPAAPLHHLRPAHQRHPGALL